MQSRVLWDRLNSVSKQFPLVPVFLAESKVQCSKDGVNIEPRTDTLSINTFLHRWASYGIRQSILVSIFWNSTIMALEGNITSSLSLRSGEPVSYKLGREWTFGFWKLFLPALPLDNHASWTCPQESLQLQQSSGNPVLFQDLMFSKRKSTQSL